MARYNLVQIDGVYITTDGLVTGTRCRTEVSGLVPLRPANSRIVREAVDGTPLVQYRSHKGKPVAVRILATAKDVLDDLIAAIDTAEAGGDAHNVVVSGDTGDFDLDCVLEGVESPGEFRSGIVNDLTLNFRVHTVNSITAGS